MGLTTMNKNRPILITGKSGTGKTTKALSLLESPIVVFGDACELDDIHSLPVSKGILIEDIHYKPDKESILYILRHYQGKIVLTSINEKSVPKEIKSMCQIKRAGTKKFLRESIERLAPRSEEPFSYEMDTYSLTMRFLKENDRDLMAEFLKFNKPSDTQILNWLVENIHPNRLIFVDGVVKRRWSQQYFYEMLAYSHSGNYFGRLAMPKRGTYSKIPSLARRLGVKEERLLHQLLKDEEFKQYAKSKLNNSECRMLKLGEKRRRKKTDPIQSKQSSLFEY
jgi:hypothetical protein